jgi:hypothetical protein
MTRISTGSFSTRRFATTMTKGNPDTYFCDGVLIRQFDVHKSAEELNLYRRYNSERNWKESSKPVEPEKIGGIATSMLLTQRKPVLSLSKDRRVKGRKRRIDHVALPAQRRT